MCVQVYVYVFTFEREREREIERWAFNGDDVSFSILYLRIMTVKKCRVFPLLLL